MESFLGKLLFMSKKVYTPVSQILYIKTITHENNARVNCYVTEGYDDNSNILGELLVNSSPSLTRQPIN